MFGTKSKLRAEQAEAALAVAGERHRSETGSLRDQIAKADQSLAAATERNTLLRAELATAQSRAETLNKMRGQTIVVTDRGRWELTPAEKGLAFSIECRGGHVVDGLIFRKELDDLVFGEAELEAASDQPSTATDDPAPAADDPVTEAVLALGDDATLTNISAHVGRRVSWQELSKMSNITRVPGVQPAVYKLVGA